MLHPFTEAFRRQVAARCAALPRLAMDATALGLKPAAVAITLVEAEGAQRAAPRSCSPSAPPACARTAASGRCRAGAATGRSRWSPPRCASSRRRWACGSGRQAALGLLDDYPTRSGYLVTPVVLWAGEGVVLRPNPDEVAAVYRVALADIAREDAVDFVSIPESDRRVVRVYIEGSRVHAPTAAFLYQFRELLAGRITRVADLEQPVFAWR